MKHIRAAAQGCDFLLHRAIRKYGAKSFQISLIDTAETIQDAQFKEKFYIEKFQTFYKNNMGYNMTLGGENAIQNRGENNGRSIATDEMRMEAIFLLLTTTYTQKEIAQIVEYPGETDRALEGFVHDLNVGRTFKQEGLDYPLRKNRSLSAPRGFKNGNSLSVEKVNLVIKLLETTNWSFTKIQKETGVNRHLVSDINSCHKYSESHGYHTNIRKESQLND